MHAARVIFAFQVVPGTDEILGFAETLGIARQEASQHFEGLRTMEARRISMPELRSTGSA